ncbi:ABC transporter related [Candidatus Moduliflexus flocculans]|uniref:ABC transporter related n=1 Tax=Candidatus Moduliflexus flocculans TaxID=1499966 RepID=A0A0S6W3C2_9BACT|nr:ABC transporter related [Candidatus Moduliflexus flocculans]
MQPLVIELREITKRYGRLDALRNVSFSVPVRSVLTIFGPNGSGKTTLIRILATLLRPTSGMARIVGHDPVQECGDVRKQIGVVLHQSLLYETLTARENLEFYGKMFGVSDMSARIKYVLESVGLAERGDDIIRAFSRGMQQRVAIARALLHDPQVLLLDEAFSGLDANAVATLRQLLERFHQEGRAIVLTTHHYQLGLELATHAALLVNGGLRYFGEPTGVMSAIDAINHPPSQDTEP